MGDRNTPGAAEKELVITHHCARCLGSVHAAKTHSRGASMMRVTAFLEGMDAGWTQSIDRLEARVTGARAS